MRQKCRLCIDYSDLIQYNTLNIDCAICFHIWSVPVGGQGLYGENNAARDDGMSYGLLGTHSMYISGLHIAIRTYAQYHSCRQFGSCLAY